MDIRQIDQLLQNDLQFRSQFDRSSDYFHGGDPTPVPIGGQRVPEGMTEAPQSPPEEQKAPEDPRYSKVMSARAYLQDFKKLIALVCPPVEARLRAKGMSEGEARDRHIEEAENKIIQVVDKVRESKLKLEEHKEYVPDYSGEIEFIIENAGKNYEQKEDYGDFMLRVGIFSKKIFKDIQNLLQVIKDIKSGKI